MTTNFNSVQMFEISEVCNKFSKSVSYETLVGETTTIGTGIKQTQRLNKGSADKLLIAVGTLTSLLCNSAKVMEKLLRHVITRRTLVRRGYLPEQGTHADKESLFASVTCFMRLPRRIQRMLLVMTIPALALIFTLATTAESRAIDATSGTCNTAGTCLWELDSDGTLTISAKDGAKNVEMDNYVCQSNSASSCVLTTLKERPWENQMKQIKNVYIGDNIINIGQDAFQTASNLKTVNGMKDVKTIVGGGTFAYTGLTDITLPQGLTEIGRSSFTGSTKLTSITIPASLEKIEGKVFNGIAGLNEINCTGTATQCENLHGLLENGGYLTGRTFNVVAPVENCNSYTNSGCTKCYSGYAFGNGSCHACGEGKNCHWDEIKESTVFDGCLKNYLRKENKCVVASAGCGENFRLNDGWCDRQLYTPAEAAKVLRDDNTNEVVITFKK